MAQVIIGNDAVFEAMQPVNYSLANLSEYVRSTAQRYAAAFGNVTSAINTYVTEWTDQYMNSDAARKAAALLRQAGSYFTEDQIRPLREIWELQNAPAKMLRGIMAMPEARNLGNRGMCNAYNGRYIDQFPEKRAEDHRDYKFVYDGHMSLGADESDIDHSHFTYSDDFLTNDEYEFLTVEQRDNIIATRELMWKSMVEDRDFTDPEDGPLY